MRDGCGAAAAEMALVTPLLVTLMFGGMEAGNFMWQQHIVTKAVRDGARFAGREPFAAYSCSSVSGDVATVIKNVTATGQVTGGSKHIPAFTSATVTIEVSCSAGTKTGIYAGQANGAPVVRVQASVPYTALFSTLIMPSGLSLNASAQSAVMGL